MKGGAIVPPVLVQPFFFFWLLNVRGTYKIWCESGGKVMYVY